MQLLESWEGQRAPEPGLEEEQGLEQEGAKGSRSTFLFHLAVNRSAFLLRTVASFHLWLGSWHPGVGEQVLVVSLLLPPVSLDFSFPKYLPFMLERQRSCCLATWPGTQGGEYFAASIRHQLPLGRITYFC